MVDVPVDVRIGVNLTSLLLMNYTEVLKMGFSLNWNAHDCSIAREVADIVDPRIISLFVFAMTKLI